MVCMHVLYKELCGVNESRSMHVFGILSLVCGLCSLAPLPKHKFIYRGWEGSLLGTLFFEVFRSTSWHFKRPDLGLSKHEMCLQLTNSQIFITLNSPIVGFYKVRKLCVGFHNL